MNRQLITSLTLMCLLLFGSKKASADFTSVYDPALLPTNPDATESDFSDAQFGRRYATPFQLSGSHQNGSTAIHLTFWGGVRLGGDLVSPPGGYTMPDPLSFRFRIYETDQNGRPGVQVGGWQQISTVASSAEIYREHIQSNGMFYTKSYHEYAVDLNGVADLQAGTEYFLEIMERSVITGGPNPDDEQPWSWLGSVNDFDEYYSSIQPTNWIGGFQVRSRAFSLDVAEVPEPASILLSSLGFLGFGLLRNRHRSKL